MQYSIWVIPPEPVFSRLQKIIDELSSEYGGPRFEPHMTVLGDIEEDLATIRRPIEKLAADLDSLELTLGTVSFGITHFQSVFASVNPTPDLLKLNSELKKLFRLENRSFAPHISLLYGRYDMATKERAASKIKLPSSSFVVNEFVITPATSNPTEWEHSLVIPFGHGK